MSCDTCKRLLRAFDRATVRYLAHPDVFGVVDLQRARDLATVRQARQQLAAHRQVCSEAQQ